MRVRSLIIAVIAAIIAVGSTAASGVDLVGSTAGADVPNVVAPSLSERLATAKPTDRLVVMVHADTTGAAMAAARSAGLVPITTWESVAVAVAAGTPAQVRAVLTAPDVTYVEADQPLSFTLDTALEATRADEVLTEPLTVTQTTTETSGRCRNQRKPRDGCTTTTSTTAGPFDGRGQTIAIVDSGIDGTHPMFQEDGKSRVVRNLKVACHDLACMTFSEVPVPADQMLIDMTAAGNDTDSPSAGGHGTHVAGIAAGGRVDALGKTFSGVAPGAKLVGISTGAAIAVVGADTALNWIALNHTAPCGEGVSAEECPPITVVNNSYGPDGGGEFDPKSATAKLQRLLVSKGIVMVWANGNDGGTGSANVSNPDGQDLTPGIISVANYNDLGTGERDGVLNASSSRGRRGDVRTYPDLSAPGTNILSACRQQLAICEPSAEDPDYGTISGTSMAAPHVAGAVAVLQQAMKAKGTEPTPAAIEDALEDTARQFAFAASYERDVVPDEKDANGAVFERNADHTTSFDKGHGLLDLRAAVESVFGVSAPKPGVTKVCPSGTALSLTDEPGDHGFAGSPATDDPALDILAATITADPATHTVTLTIQVDDLPTPEQSRGEMFQAGFWHGGFGHTMEFGRPKVGVNEALVYTPMVDGVATDEDPTYDAENDIVTYAVPAAAFSPNLSGLMTLDGFTVDTLSATPLAAGLYADDAASACAATMDAGDVPAEAPVVPDPSSYDARLAVGGSDAWSGTVPAPVNTLFIDTTCILPDDPRCDTRYVYLDLGDRTMGTLTIDLVPSEGNDMGVVVYDPDETYVDGTDAEAGAEHLEVGVSRSGVYRISVWSFASVPAAPYDATATLT